jgi:hypothetical protein
MFKPKMSPYHREELRSDFDKRGDADYTPPEPVVKKTPKPKGLADIAMGVCMNTTMSKQEAEAVVGQFWAEHLVADTPRNAELIERFMAENHCDYTVENVRVAVRVLGYPFDKLDRRKPEPPPPPTQPVVVVEPPPFDFSTLSDTDELPLDTPEWRLKTATSAQLRSFLKRAGAAKNSK